MAMMRGGLLGPLLRGAESTIAAAAAASRPLNDLRSLLPRYMSHQPERESTSSSPSPARPQQQEEQPSPSSSGRPASALLAARSISHSLASCSTPSAPQPLSPFGSLRHLQRKQRNFELPPEVNAMILAARGQRRKVPEQVLPPPVASPMTPQSVRVGCIAVKAGMTQEWDEWGVRVPLTVLWIDDCQVVGIRSPERDGYVALQVGAGFRPQKAQSPGMAGFYLAKDLPFKQEQCEFRVSPDALLPVGTPIVAGHFVAGQRLDVTGWTKWKGFQGVMKRWGMAGMPATHGTSLTHRGPGTVGSRKDPGKVFKGKHMAGFMGNERRTVHNALLYRVDPERNLLYVRGQVPGPAGDFIFLRDASNVTEAFRTTWGVPFPTLTAAAVPAPGAPAEVAAAVVPGTSVYRNPKDPYRKYSEEVDYFEVKWKKSD